MRDRTEIVGLAHVRERESGVHVNGCSHDSDFPSSVCLVTQ